MTVPEYSPRVIEPKWQRRWSQARAFEASNDSDRPKFFALVEFPYPSGEGLHAGHPRPYTAMDIVARKRRMQGYNVLFPMGWDAFGLPTENYAIKHRVHPRVVTQRNISRFRKQCQSIGFSFDWTREVDTTDPNYYRWTQWIFLQLYKRGLAYKSEMPINYCTSCKVGLANEEVVGGVCERCGGEVVRRIKKQWMLKITAYAQTLLDGLDTVDFLDKIKAQQRNWIGRSEGAGVDFQLLDDTTGEALEPLRVFTTRPDTLFGATYMVVAPEHPLIDDYANRITNLEAVRGYRDASSRKSDFERTEIAKDKTGVPIEGVAAVNPATGKRIPIWASDYVMMGYGTGAIMAVPAHDERDWEFARRFDLPIVEVVAGGDIQSAAYTDVEDGELVNSGFLDGLRVPDAKRKITAWLVERGLGEPKVQYKLRDWVFSRQRYWGEPIPIVDCPRCGLVPLPEDQLPLLLPEADNYLPTDTGESPLAAMTDWVNTTCPCCGGPAKRETDTMPQWAGSSWYFLRYMDPHNDDEFASKKALDYWGMVDWYNGGMEHTTLHLLYSRFWHHFLYDIGAAPYAEPYAKRTSHGMILGANGEKMSKSRGNVVNPDDVIAEFGADTLRMYEMFLGAFDQAIPWSTQGVAGCRRFLDRVWRVQQFAVSGEGIPEKIRAEVHGCVKKVTEDIERMKFNTAIASMMTLVNVIYTEGVATRGTLRTLLALLNPFAPHITEEIWELQGLGEPIYAQPWPKWDPAALVRDEIEIAVQVGGKVRGRVTLPLSLSKDEAERTLPDHPEIQRLASGRPIRKLIYVPGKIVNLVL
ncbi:MAG: leucine--tRNA ligase [Oscillospiraceae bacterium]|jgi:leucyl-tRNA synthetase|nr:leucine--tRNA ligase [Oscillospiraceae bacterium]